MPFSRADTYIVRGFCGASYNKIELPNTKRDKRQKRD